MTYYVYDGRVFDDQDDVGDYRDVNPGGTTQRFETLSEANASLSGGMLTGTSTATSDREYRYVKEPSDLSGGSSRNVWDATKIGVARGDAGLKELYDSRKEYAQLFDSFNNFKSYMNEIQDLYDSEALSPWYKTQSIREWTDAEYGEGTYDEIREEASEAEAFGEQDTGVARLRDDYEAAMAPIREEQFKAFIASPEYQGLSQKYGLNDVVRNQDGDIFAFNGGWPVEIFEVDDHMGPGDYLKVAAAIGLTALAGPYLASALAPSAGAVGTTIGAAASGAVTSGMSQLIINGEIDINQLAQAALSAGVSTAAINALEQAGTIEEITEWLDSQVGEFVQLEDGQEFSLNILPGQEPTVTLPSGAVLDYDVFLGLAENVYGSPVVAEISRGLPDWLNTVVDAANPAFEAARNALQAANVISGGRTSGGVGSTVTNVEPINDTTTVVSQLQEAIENARNEGDDEQVNALQVELGRYQEGVEEETEEVEVTDPDSSTVDDPDSELRDTTTTPDTTIDTEENPPGITEEMFNDVVDRVREDGQVQTQEIIDALNALGVADLPTLAQIKKAFPELNDVSLEQIKDTVSTLLSNAGLLTTEAFSEAMAGVLTPEQLATALANLPYGDAQDFIDAISKAGYATPEDVATALKNADLMSNEDFNTYMEQFRKDVVGDVDALLETALADFPFPDTFTDEQIQQLRDTIVIPESATMEQIQSALDALAKQIPAAAPTLEEMKTLFNTELANLNIASPQDVKDALTEFNFSDAQIAQIINALPAGLTVADLGTALKDVVVGEDLDAAITTITDAIGGLEIASTEDIKTLLTEYGFTNAQLQQISQAVNIPESVTLTELRQELNNLPKNLTAQEVIDLMLASDIATKSDFQTMLDKAFENFAFPDTFTDDQIKQIKDNIIFPETASMSQIQTALDKLAEQIPEAGPSLNEIQKLFTDTLGGLSIASPQDVKDALSEFEFNESQINQIINALPENISNSDLTTALEGIVVGEDLDAAVTKITGAIGALNIASPEDIKTILSEYGFTNAQLQQIVNALPENINKTDLTNALENVVVGEDLDTAVTTITDAISGLAIASPDDVRNILTNYGFTEAQLNQISGAVTIPPSATVAEVQQIVDSIPAGLTAEEVSTELSSQFEGLTRDISGVQSGIDQLAEDLGLSTEGLLTAISNLGGADGENLTTLQTNILTGLGDLSTNLGVDIGDVVTSVTGLETGVAEGIEGLGLQLTGLGEGITDVQGGIKELAENLGLSTEALVLAISNLGTATGENLTGLQTSILTGLGSLADTLGVDVGEVVTSVTTLSTDVAEGIEGLEGQLETGFEGVQGGIDALAEQLGVSSEDIVTAIGNLGTLTSEELTGFETSVLTGLTDLASTLGLDIGDVVTSVTDLGTGLTENITGLSEQLTGVGEAVGGVTTAVTQGVETLAEALGVQTDDIEAAIVTLGSGLGGELTDLETNVLLGLTGLADSIGTDIGTVVDSITGVGTGLGENIQGLSDTLTEQLGAGFGGLGGQLESGFGQLGQQLGLATLGLFGLGAKQPTAQEIAAAQDKFEFKPFEETARPRQVQQVVQSAPVKQQPTALEQINQFIGRQTSTPQVKPINQGMFTGDPNRKLA